MRFSSVKVSIAAAVFGLAIATTSASAGTVNVTYQGSNVFGTPNYSRAVSITSPTYTGGAQAGAFRLVGDNGFGSFVGFCVDLANFMTSGNTYTTSGTSAYNAAVDNNIDKLFTSSYASVDTANEAAAFQLAIWEIITDTGKSLSLTGGSFLATAGIGVINTANSYLAALSGASTGGYNITYLNSRSSQDLVTVSPVPVPAALGMLGLGLASLFGLRRRKKA